MYLISIGSTVCGFATDIDNLLVDGVITTKEQAQVAFENAVRFLYLDIDIYLFIIII